MSSALALPLADQSGRACKYACGNPARARRTACGSCEKRMACHGHLGTCGYANSRLLAEDSPHWAGAEVGYWAAHKRLRRYLGPAKEKRCTRCTAQAFDWAYLHNDPDERISEDPGFSGRPYSTKPECYAPMCRSCHKVFDAT
jgi:hypothetical protein